MKSLPCSRRPIDNKKASWKGGQLRFWRKHEKTELTAGYRNNLLPKHINVCFAFLVAAS
jgi:hypothetical protein